MFRMNLVSKTATTTKNAMLQYFALPTGTGAAVCYDSHSLRGAMAIMECATLQHAWREAIRRNLASARRPIKSLPGRQTSVQRSSARFFEIEAA
jgi:hypothetical protein